MNLNDSDFSDLPLNHFSTFYLICLFNFCSHSILLCHLLFSHGQTARKYCCPSKRETDWGRKKEREMRNLKQFDRMKNFMHGYASDRQATAMKYSFRNHTRTHSISYHHKQFIFLIIYYASLFLFAHCHRYFLRFLDFSTFSLAQV